VAGCGRSASGPIFVVFAGAAYASPGAGTWPGCGEVGVVAAMGGGSGGSGGRRVIGAVQLK